MSAANGSPPALTATTVAIDDPGPLLGLLDPRNPLAFLRSGDGIVGIGAAMRLEFSGPGRLTAAAAAWRSVVADSSVADPVMAMGTGLVALGTFTFSDSSSARSVLIVPELVVGRRAGQHWMTRIASDRGIPQPVPFGISHHTELVPGTMAPERFLAAVRDIVARIDTGAASKVVISRDLTGRIPADADLRVPIGRLAQGYPDTVTFAIDGLVGASPETLVRTAAGAVSARVLAGSAARGTDAATDVATATALASSAKNLAEHGFALRSVLSALEHHSSGLSTSTTPYPLELPNLWHLASDVTGTLADGSTALDLVAALHPTAAVAGSPTATAVGIIEELEPFDRGRYAGPVGWVDNRGGGEWAIALRCAQITDGEIRAYAGAGIVAGSEAEQELAETVLKFRPIVEAFR